MTSGKGQSRVCERQCMGCMNKFDRRELVRFVNRGGRAEPDPEMKAQTRGAYVCPNPSCLARAVKTGRLKQRLKLRESPVGLIGSITDSKQ